MGQGSGPSCFPDNSAIAHMVGPEAPIVQRALLPCAVHTRRSLMLHAPTFHSWFETCVVAPPSHKACLMFGRNPWCHSTLWRKTLHNPKKNYPGGPPTVEQAETPPRGFQRTSWADSLPNMPKCCEPQCKRIGQDDCRSATRGMFQQGALFSRLLVQMRIQKQCIMPQECQPFTTRDGAPA